MQKRNQALIDMKREELCLQIAKRVSKVSPGMSFEEVDRKARRAVKVLRKIQDVPRYS